MVILALWEVIILYKSVCCVTEDVFTIKPGVDGFFFFFKEKQILSRSLLHSRHFSTSLSTGSCKSRQTKQFII